jgi:xanthine/CO dehydrogenase XdhC/CoxF family maturation factor
MKEIREILNRLSEIGDDEVAILATVIDVNGSGYRRPGAKMLILRDGRTFGMVSGGCLEADLIERTAAVFADRRPRLITYDTTNDDRSVFNLNMGCRGVLRLLIEVVTPNSGIIEILGRVYLERRVIVTAVVVGSESPTIAIGSRLSSDGSSPTDPDGLSKAFPLIKDDLLTFFGARSGLETIEYEIDGQIVELAFENVQPPVQLLILGAGADAVPLASMAHEVGLQVSVFDHRQAFLSKDRFPDANDLVLLDRDASPDLRSDTRTAIVAMNHNYERDKVMIGASIPTNSFYLGALGPKERTRQILKELEAEGRRFTPEQMAKLYAPAGLDLGGDSPESIALSIIAEIQAVIRERDGGHLRDREGSIYDRH